MEFMKRPLCIECEWGDEGLFRSWNEAVKLVLEATTNDVSCKRSHWIIINVRFPERHIYSGNSKFKSF